MAERRKLTNEEVRTALDTLPNWRLQQSKLHRDYAFGDFAHAIGFMATAAVLIEKMNHHPEWSNVYNRVAVDLTTHDAGGITAKDVELARLLEDVAKPLAVAK
ncbi:MAG TPA: 4a-hydroxytetrahydrobiopterin dehydratase [Bryobacteraceae bacterium]|nr:4a-hydroxytetrahydrobiopterin dehydratase [Bryobacteraceae bacterium]